MCCMRTWVFLKELLKVLPGYIVFLKYFEIHATKVSNFNDVRVLSHQSIKRWGMDVSEEVYHYLITHEGDCSRCLVSQSLQGGYVSIHCCCEKACLYLHATTKTTSKRTQEIN